MAKTDIVDIDDDNDLAALRSSAPRGVGGATVQSRAKREKPRSPTDGRRHRVAGSERQVPLNVDIPPETKALVVKASIELGLPMKTFVAQAIEHYYRALEIEAQSESS
jgi:hypothetical protein